MKRKELFILLTLIGIAFGALALNDVYPRSDRASLLDRCTAQTPVVRRLVFNVRRNTPTSPEEKAHPETVNRFFDNVEAAITVRDVTAESFEPRTGRIVCQATIEIDSSALDQAVQNYPYMQTDQKKWISTLFRLLTASFNDTRKRYKIERTSTGSYITLLN